MRERAVSLEHTGLVPRPIRDKLRRSVFGVLGPAGAGARILNASDRRVWIVLLTSVGIVWYVAIVVSACAGVVGSSGGTQRSQIDARQQRHAAPRRAKPALLAQRQN